MDALKKKVESNKSAILQDLDLNKDFLALLTKNGVVDVTNCVKLQQIEDKTQRNETFLDILLNTADDTLYLKLIECLQKSGQSKLANRLIDIGEEMLILNQMYNHLDTQLKQMSEFLSTEERRAGIYLTEPQLDEDDGKPALTEAEVWFKVQESIKRSQQQLARCQSVIQKLHQDCETVAKQNSDIVEYTKECDAKIKEVLSVGRLSAKKASAPKKTQDLFANLMDDIEKLVKTRRKVITMETEGRRHSTRIVRQCRDWLEGRSIVLQKVNALPGPGAYRSFETPGDGEITVNIQRVAPPTNDNAIMSILDSLQLLEKELQAYIHQEVTLTDKYRSEIRRKHLQKRVHGFNTQGIADMENALKNLDKDPQSLKDNMEMIKSSISEINREYGECVSYLNKIDIGEEGSVANSSPIATQKEISPSPRDWPANFKKKTAKMGGKLARSLDNNIHTVGLTGKERVEPNQLLNKIKMVAVKHEEMKSEELNLSSKYRSEMSRKKREMDIALQKKEDQIMKLQTQLKETEAEKEKYKKLYNDTKIGYQRNRETVTSPR